MFLRQPGLVFHALEAEKHTYLALPTTFQGPVPAQGQCFPAGLLSGLGAGSQCPRPGLYSYLITWKNTTLPWEADRPHSPEGILCPAGVDLSRNAGLRSRTVLEGRRAWPPCPRWGSGTSRKVALGRVLTGLRRRGRGRQTPRMCLEHKCLVTGWDVKHSLTRFCFYRGEIRIRNFTILTIL